MYIKIQVNIILVTGLYWKRLTFILDIQTLTKEGYVNSSLHL
jgi:hypothetical protein